MQKDSNYCNMVLVALLACYLPYSIVLVIFTTHGSSPLLDMIWELSAILVFKPILYRWRKRHIKQQVKKTIRYILCSSDEVTFKKLLCERLFFI